MKAENEDCSGTPGSLKVLPVETVDCATSMEEDCSEMLAPESQKVSPVETVDCATSTEDLPTSSAHSTTVVDAELCPQLGSEESPASSLQVAPATDLVTESDGSKLESSQNLPGHSLSAPEVTFSVSSNATPEQELEAVGGSCSRREDMFISHKSGGTAPTECQEVDGTALPQSQEVTGRVMTSTESSTKLATRLKRRSDGAAALPVDVNSELSAKLREREQEIEQLNSDNAQMLDLLNQANAEIVRYKEVS